MSECTGVGCQHTDHAHTDKATAWTDEARAADAKVADDAAAAVEHDAAGGGPELTGLELAPDRELTAEERAALPPWVEALRPGLGVTIGGWRARIVLIDPTRGMLMLFVEGQTQSAIKRDKRAALKAAGPKHKRRK